MNTPSNEARRLDGKISYAVDPPHGDQVPLHKEGANMEQAPSNPHPLKNENIRKTLLQIAQAITTKAQAAKTQA